MLPPYYVLHLRAVDYEKFQWLFQIDDLNLHMLCHVGSSLHVTWLPTVTSCNSRKLANAEYQSR